MNRYLKFVSCALMLALWQGIPSVQAQTTVTLSPIASNLPPVFTAEINPVFNLIEPSTNIPTIMSGGTWPFDFLWSTSNSATVVISNPTDSFPTMVVNSGLLDLYQGNGFDIYMQVTDQNSCVVRDTLSSPNIVKITEINSLQADLNVYPNPNSGRFSVSLQGEPTGKGMDLVVLDAVGRLVYSEQLARFQGSLNKELDLSELSKGAYFLGFLSEGKQVFKKLMIH